MGLTSIWHWLIVLAIVVLVFGTKKLRNVGKDLGGAVHDFKEGLEKNGIACTIRREMGSDISGACGQLRRDAELEERED